MKGFDYEEAYKNLVDAVKQDDYKIIEEDLISSDNLHDGMILLIEMSKAHARIHQYEEAFLLFDMLYNLRHNLINENFSQRSEEYSEKRIDSILEDRHKLFDSELKNYDEVRKNFPVQDKNGGMFKFWRNGSSMKSSKVRFLGG